MPVVETMTYSRTSIDSIKGWIFGTNWPAVYIIYNSSSAYVGETLDLARRTEQHLLEQQFEDFTDICLISDKTYNKSVILDLESFLIKYIGADGSKKLINGNAGVVDHDYFYKEAYEDDFLGIWDKLLKLEIVKKSISDIENSELFKYSPYKSLNDEQQKAAFYIIKKLSDIYNASKQSLIQVFGGAGTGKTILAVYIVKLLTDLCNNRKVWSTVENEEEVLYLQKLRKKFGAAFTIGFVVPMGELHKTMIDIFDSIEGLSGDMILSPSDVVKKHYNLLVVDESHRLYQRKHLPGAQTAARFDKINKQIMGESYTGTEKDMTELDWIIESSDLQILFYDPLQAIRTADIDQKRFNTICKPHLAEYYNLYSQMRCKGGNGYYNYVKRVITGSKVDIHEYKIIENYKLKAVNSIDEMSSIIYERNQESGLCKIIAGPGWNISDDIIIDNQIFHWADGKKRQKENTIYSVHKIQGFDLDIAGVVFGREVYYCKETGQIEISKENLKDNFTKSSGDVEMRQFVLNIYLTLMTRGINGTIVYAMDPALNDYLKLFFN